MAGSAILSSSDNGHPIASALSSTGTASISGNIAQSAGNMTKASDGAGGSRKRGKISIQQPRRPLRVQKVYGVQITRQVISRTGYSHRWWSSSLLDLRG
jgi:hypothetical protein